MAEADGMIVYVGQYADVEDARQDYQDLEDLHQGDFIGEYDAALFQKETGGAVSVLDTDETPRAEWAVRAGLAGAVLGLLFPEFLLLAVGGAAALGAVAGHIRGGIPRADLNELGELLDEGQAGIVLITERPVKDSKSMLMKRAASRMEKPVAVDAATLTSIVDDASKE
jgi:uncharacterized membrane protein